LNRYWDIATLGEALAVALMRARKYLDVDRPLDTAARLEVDMSIQINIYYRYYNLSRRILAVAPPERTRELLRWLGGLE
jgi:hypothetical protein